ncbi:hypothetical protein F4780DRAFT_350924 [Xylariomycetidae sp. FL0641]|nr:hypothetical protein F4780DRAFT_350924 [Xylariomycetidae sp. FL0641]
MDGWAGRRRSQVLVLCSLAAASSLGGGGALVVYHGTLVHCQVTRQLRCGRARAYTQSMDRGRCMYVRVSWPGKTAAAAKGARAHTTRDRPARSYVQLGRGIIIITGWVSLGFTWTIERTNEGTNERMNARYIGRYYSDVLYSRALISCCMPKRAGLDACDVCTSGQDGLEVGKAPRDHRYWVSWWCLVLLQVQIRSGEEEDEEEEDRIA